MQVRQEFFYKVDKECTKSYKKIAFFLVKFLN